MVCVYFALGAFALIAQAILLREFFVVVFGNELVFGVLLSQWLVGIFLGAWMGGQRAEKSKQPVFLFSLFIFIVTLLLPISITGTRFLYQLSATPAGTYIDFFQVLLYSGLFIIPIGFCIGFVFPFAAKIQTNQESVRGSVRPITDIYIFEALGSLVGGMIYTFFCVGKSNAYLIAASFSVPLVCCVLLVLKKYHFYKTAFIAFIFLLIHLGIGLPVFNRTLDQKTVASRWASVSSLPLVYSIDSRYQNIAISANFGQYYLYLNTKYTAVFPNADDNMILAMQLLCQHPNPQHILIIGDALCGLAKFMLAYPIQAITSVEIDPVVVQSILKFLPAEDKLHDPRFKIVCQDGRNYVKNFLRSSVQGNDVNRFDIIYLNVPEPSTLLLNRYYTRQFFTDLAQIVNPGGVIALRITGSESYEQGIIGAYSASVFHTLSTVFPYVVVTPGVDQYFFASQQRQSVSADPFILAQRYTHSGVKPQRLGNIFYSLYPTDKTQNLHQQLVNHPSSKINTDQMPITSLYFNKTTGWYNQHVLSRFFVFFETFPFVLLISGCALIFILWHAYLFFFRASEQRTVHPFKPIHVLFAVFSGGLAGLSLELVLLYTFQSNFGNIYYIIGFIIALFMFGLPVGAFAANRFIIEKQPGSPRAPMGWMITGLLVISLLSAFLPSLTQLFATYFIFQQVFIFLLTGIVGFAVGFLFPLAVFLYLGNSNKTAQAAGKINAADHIGAAMGAFFIGTLFLPLLGITQVCLLVAFFPFLAALCFIFDLVIVPRNIKNTV